MDYTIPKASQLPQLDVVQVEVPSTIGPYGAKPVGGPPVISGGAAMANAVHAAVGVRMTQLPLTSERVQRAIVAAERSVQANGHVNGRLSSAPARAVSVAEPQPAH
jgi:hypothetical protein